MNGALAMGLLWMLSKVVESATTDLGPEAAPTPTPTPVPTPTPTPTVYMPPEVPTIVPTPFPAITPIPVSTQPPKPRPPMPVPTVIPSPGTMTQPRPPIAVPTAVPTPVSFPQPRPPMPVPTVLPTPIPTVAPTPTVAPSLRTYRVKSGDTGEKIAQAFTGEKSRWRELAKANPKIMSARADEVPKYGFPIYAGDLINLPASWEGISPPTIVAPPMTPIPVSAPAPIPSPVSIPTPTPIVSTYVVKSGDTGTSIAKKFTGDGNRWRELTTVNPTIMNARKAAAAKYGFPIYVGDVINLPASWAIAAPTASIAVGVADAAMRRASFFPSLANMLTANTAAQHAAQLTARAAKAMRAADRAPMPWPQALPRGLPAFPGGWEPDEPIRPEIMRRAWQILPALWRRGRGATAVEQVSGRWVTFVARPNGPRKGVGVYRVRGACE